MRLRQAVLAASELEPVAAALRTALGLHEPYCDPGVGEFGLENVVLTPHLAGPTYENRAKGFRNAFDNVQRVERGERPLWIIPDLR